jgi:hypothetical protein
LQPQKDRLPVSSSPFHSFLTDRFRSNLSSLIATSPAKFAGQSEAVKTRDPIRQLKSLKYQIKKVPDNFAGNFHPPAHNGSELEMPRIGNGEPRCCEL